MKMGATKIGQEKSQAISAIITGLIEEKSRIYLYKGGKQVLSEWDWLDKTGLIVRMKERGIVINPVHNFEMLKPFRQELFAKAKEAFIDETILKKLKTTDFELDCFHVMWLHNELKVVDDWLKECKSNSDRIELLKYKAFVNDEIETSEKKITLQPPQPEEKLTMREIGLLSFYEGRIITRKNADEIAKEYGHNSGEGLYQDFSKYSSRANRIGAEETRKKNMNKLQLFEKVISKLSPTKKQQAAEEMETFKAAVKNQYQ